MDNALSMLGLAFKAGKLEAGEEPACAAARAHRARLVLVAGDAAENTVRRAKRFSESGGVPMIQVDADRAALGGVLGRSSCAVMAVTDAGIAESFVIKLGGGARYEEALTELHRRVLRVEKRRREEAAHKKNVKTGGRKKS